VWGRREMHTGFWWGKLKESDHLDDLGLDGRIMLKCILHIMAGRGLDTSVQDRVK
jgi:hypothetical protein